ncbi:MAG: SDR family oxidoreductase [Candidatus Acidiferrales bacterium]
MDLGLAGKVVIVTGGDKGIGGGITRALAKEGAVPVIVARDINAIQKIQAELKAAGARSHAVTAELSRPEECERAVREALAAAGRLDALVNNAGVNDGVGLETGNPEQFVVSLKKNLLHYYCMAHYALPALKAARGSIVDIGSKVAITGQGRTSGYAASKGGIMGLTREWAVELLPYGIRVNSVLPAEVMTPLYERWINTFPDPKTKLASIISSIPLKKRMTTSEEIAAMVVFLISGQSGHTTGQHLIVDGGYVHLDRALT